MKNKKINFLKNYFVIFVIVYFIIIITKIMFFYFLKNNFLEYSVYQSFYAIFWGYKFDFATSAIIAFIVSLFDFSKKAFAFIGATSLTALFLLQISDILYFNESSRHIGYEISDIFTDADSLFMTAYSQYSLFTIISIFIAIMLFLLSYKFLLKCESVELNKTYILKKLFLIILSVFFIRGMTQHIPLNPWQSNQIGDIKLASLSLNVTYNVIYSLANKKKKLQKMKLPIVSDDLIKTSFKNLYQENKTKISYPMITSTPNIVFLFLESWSAQYLKSYGYEHNTTPYFNDILKKSIRPTLMLAGGHRTTEGMFCSLTSLQNPLGKTVAKTQLQNYKYTSIIDVFNKIGYSSAFFQGSSKETSGTGSFAQNLGFKYSYGKRDIKTRIYEENYWGVHDVDLYNFTISKLDNKLKEPFVIGINGATTHDDKIPKEIKKIEFVDDVNLNNQLNALHFSDFALKKFIQEMEVKYPNTIFVMLADHCGGKISGTIQNYMIPFAIYSKKLIQPKYYDTYLSQRDVAPTLYDMVIGSYKQNNLPFSGKSLISESSFFSDYYHNGVLGWVENNNVVEINIITNTMKCFNIFGLNKKEVECSNIHKKMKNNALAFTYISQKLLFNNEIDKFNIYRNLK